LSSEKFKVKNSKKFKMPLGPHLGEEKGIKTEVGGVHEISKKNRNRYPLMGDPKALYQSGMRRRNG
jgi:hypothetical protein